MDAVEVQENAPASAITDEMLMQNTAEREDLTDADHKQMVAMHQLIDETLTLAETSDIDGPEDLLSRRICAMLDKKLPREAIVKIYNERLEADTDGNQAIRVDSANFVSAAIVDYLADKIFRHLLSTKVKSHSRLFEGSANVSLPGAQPVIRYEYVVSACVQVKVRLRDGSYWTKEAYGVGYGISNPGEDRSHAVRKGEVGAVTNARKNAIQLLGPVFNGFDIRDYEGIIKQVKTLQEERTAQRREQAAQEQSQQRAIENADAKTVAKKAAPALDPALAQSTTAAIVAKPAAVLVQSEAKKPKALGKKDERTDNKPFRVVLLDGKEKGATADASLFAKEISSQLIKAKTQDDLDKILANNANGLQLLATQTRWAELADQIRAAAESKKTLFAEKAARAAETAAARAQREEKRAKSKARRKAAETAEAAAAAVETTAAGAGDPGATEAAGAEAGTSVGTENVAAEGPATDPVPASAPKAEAQTAAEPAAEATVPTVAFEPIRTDDAGKVLNLSAFGQSMLEAIKQAKTAEALDNLFARASESLALVPEQTRNYLTGQANRRKDAIASGAVV